MPAAGRVIQGLALLGPLTLLATLPAHADAVVARSGSITLTESAVRQLLDRLEPPVRQQLIDDPSLLSQFVRNRLARMAVLAEAKAKKWEQTPAVAFQIEEAKSDVIIDTYLASLAKLDPNFPSEAEVSAAYEANKARFLVPRQYKLAQIFLPVDAGAGNAEDEKAKKRLQEFRQQVESGKADFADLARRYSEDKASAENGGALDWVTENRLAPQVGDVVAGLEKGGVGEPVRVADGWHLIRLIDTRPASVAPLADVRAELVKLMRQQRTQENTRVALAELLKKTPVQLNEIELSRISGK